MGFAGVQPVKNCSDSGRAKLQKLFAETTDADESDFVHTALSCPMPWRTVFPSPRSHCAPPFVIFYTRLERCITSWRKWLTSTKGEDTEFSVSTISLQKQNIAYCPIRVFYGLQN